MTTRENSLGYFEVVGEVANESVSAVGFVTVSGAVKDATGRILDTNFAYVIGRNVDLGGILTDTGIFAKDRVPFHLYFPETAGKADSAKSISYIVTYRLAGSRSDVPDSTTIKHFVLFFTFAQHFGKKL